PVALAAYAGSGIARSNPILTGVTASRLAIAAFLIPYIFVSAPAMLLIDGTWVEVLRVIATALVGMFAVAVALTGFYRLPMTWIERGLFLAGGLLMVDPGVVTDGVGIVLVLAGMAHQGWRRS